MAQDSVKLPLGSANGVVNYGVNNRHTLYVTVTGQRAHRQYEFLPTGFTPTGYLTFQYFSELGLNLNLYHTYKRVLLLYNYITRSCCLVGVATFMKDLWQSYARITKATNK